jgi:hypothetical protein
VIPVVKAPKPRGFDEKVRKPGLRAIAEMVGKKPPYPRTAGKPFRKIASREADLPHDAFPAYWVESLDDLMAAYGQLCAYSCFRIHRITGGRSVDHFAPKSRSWRHVYSWSNYRLCCSRMNARKNEFGDILDPFLVKPGWFRLELLGFEVHPNPRLSRDLRDAILATIARLGLNDSDFRRQREQDATSYWQKDISLDVLRRESPLVALELRRLKRLNKGDIW